MRKRELGKTAASGMRERTRSSITLHEWYLLLSFESPLLAESEYVAAPGPVQQGLAEYEHGARKNEISGGFNEKACQTDDKF